MSSGLDEGRCDNSDQRFYNFSRLLLKNAEHDWGRSGGAMSSDQTSGWTNPEFHAKLAVETTPVRQVSAIVSLFWIL